MSIRSPLDVYGENARSISLYETESCGLIGYCCIGAMMVGSIELTAKPGEQLQKGDEYGYFAFGGSTIVLLFQRGVVEFDADLLKNSAQSLETLVDVVFQFILPFVAENG